MNDLGEKIKEKQNDFAYKDNYFYPQYGINNYNSQSNSYSDLYDIEESIFSNISFKEEDFTFSSNPSMLSCLNYNISNDNEHIDFSFN